MSAYGPWLPVSHEGNQGRSLMDTGPVLVTGSLTAGDPGRAKTFGGRQ